MKCCHGVENKNVPEHSVIEVTKNFDSDKHIIAQKKQLSDMLFLTILSNSISCQALVLNFLTNSYLIYYIADFG
jgi:hypothetical protein